MKFFSSSSAKTNYPAPTEIALPDSWSVFEGQHGQHRLVGALREGVAPLMGHPGYRHQVGVALLLNQPDENGMPGAEESERIYALEDKIQDRLEEGNQSLLVAKWFVRGCRELVFYTMDVKETTRRLDEIAAQGTRNQLQLTTNKDPDWKVLRQFATAA